jgi:hypothetical protein
VYDIATKAISPIDGKQEKRHYQRITDWFTKKICFCKSFLIGVPIKK